MNPTICPGDKIVANMLAYSFQGPQRWDIVLFHPKESQNKDDLWTMRVVGLPGEKISFSDEGRIVINDQRVRVPSAITSVQFKAIDSSRVRIIDGPIPVFFPYLIPKDAYFLLGDNTNNAYDSRYWGALPRENIVGKVLGK